jgi:predicted signal transduction protein with EAL and GGDEF domain
MGKRMVAEGIEHVGPVPNLMKMGRMEFQGYLLSPPVPAHQLDQLVQQWRSGIEMPEAFRQWQWRSNSRPLRRTESRQL